MEEYKRRAFGYVYRVTCKANMKSYIGQTTSTVERRFSGHVYYTLRMDSQLPFHRALRKYGIEQFSIETLEECDSIEQLNRAEKHWILEFKTLVPGGYNCNTGGDSFIVCDETKRRMSQACMGRKMSDETKKKISIATTGEKN